MRAFAFFAVLFMAAAAFGQGVFHPASQVSQGTFGSELGGGNYTFNNSMFVVDKLGIGTIAPAERLVVNGSLRVNNAIGSAVLFANATSGNVGIGTASPARKLSVQASLGSGTPFMLATNDYNGVNTGSTFVVEFGAASGNNYTMLGALSAGGSQWNNLILQPSGNVGIGTTTPSQKLDVSGNVNVSGTVYAGAFSSNSPLQLQTGGTTRLYINDTTGNVGIGTTSPTQPLEVVGSIKLSGAGGENYIMPTTNSNTIRIGDGGSYFGVQPNYGSGVVAVFTWNFERKLIFRTGNIGIGTTDPGVKLDVSGTIRGTRVEGACMPQGVAVWDSSGIAKCCAGTASYTGMPVLYICN